jgi:hypothetical protein
VLLVWRWCGGCRPAIPCRAVVASLAAVAAGAIRSQFHMQGAWREDRIVHSTTELY